MLGSDLYIINNLRTSKDPPIYWMTEEMEFNKLSSFPNLYRAKLTIKHDIGMTLMNQWN